MICLRPGRSKSLVSAVQRTSSIRSCRSTRSVVALNEPNGGRNTTGLGRPMVRRRCARPAISRRWPASPNEASMGWDIVWSPSANSPLASACSPTRPAWVASERPSRKKVAGAW